MDEVAVIDLEEIRAAVSRCRHPEEGTSEHHRAFLMAEVDRLRVRLHEVMAGGVRALERAEKAETERDAMRADIEDLQSRLYSATEGER